MKNLILILLAVLLNSGFIFSQWDSTFRMTNNTGGSYTCYNNTKCIANNGSIVHVVWHDERAGGIEVFYKRSTDYGTTWGADTRITNDPLYSGLATIAANGSVVHIVWVDNRDNQYELYYKRSTDDGLTWGTDTRLTVSSSSLIQKVPSLAVSGQNVHIAWYDMRDGNTEVYYKRSTNGGINWGSDTRLTNNSSASTFASLCCSGNNIYIVWTDTRDGNEEIYFKKSLDNGNTWSADTRLTNNDVESRNPSITVSGNYLFVAWSDYRSISVFRTYYKISTDNGQTWGADTYLPNSYYAYRPCIYASGPNVHCVWEDGRANINPDIYYRKSTDYGQTWEPEKNFCNNIAESELCNVYTIGEKVFVLWTDYMDGNYEIYMRKNPTGNFIGIQTISTEVPQSYSLKQNYPNPFNPVTNINFSLPVSGYVKLSVYDGLGREINTIVNEYLMPGTYNADWNASNYSSGIYFYKLQAGDFTETKRMVLVK